MRPDQITPETTDEADHVVEEVIERKGERTTGSIPKKSDSWKMFDRIAHRYDLLNRLLSGRRDVAWRKRVSRLLPDRKNLDLLDIATGTGDLMLSICEHSTSIRFAIGADMSSKMLTIAGEKLEGNSSERGQSLVRCDALALPFADETFDVVTIAFGVRNLTDVRAGLGEMRRVLKPEGRVLILEFSLPRNRLIRGLYLFYFRKVLPRLGSVISGDSYAYHYLNQTVESFPYGDDFARLMREAGFANIHLTPLTFGVAMIYTGDAGSSDPGSE